MAYREFYMGKGSIRLQANILREKVFQVVAKAEKKIFTLNLSLISLRSLQEWSLRQTSPPPKYPTD